LGTSNTRDETDFARHVDYIHDNLVKHRLFQSPLDWPYSGFSRHVKAGVDESNWGSNSNVL